MSLTATRTLHGIPDIRLFFHRNETPIYFISATNFNLLGIDEWVRNFRFISYIDCFDGQHPSCGFASEIPHRPFTSIEDINNYLLEHKEVVDFIRGRSKRRCGRQSRIPVFRRTDRSTCANSWAWKSAFLQAKLRQSIDNKIMTTRIGDRAGISSVPNVLARS